VTDAKFQDFMTAVVESFTVGRTEIESAFALLCKLAPAGYGVQASQLLALRRYVMRGGPGVVAQWPWTAEQRLSRAKKIDALLERARMVQTVFERENPGYTLGYTRERSLERQVQLWLENDSVVIAGTMLFNAAQSELKQSVYDAPPSQQTVNKFTRFLKTYTGTLDASNAAPGLSDHGQLKAVDFYIMKGGRTVASIRRATIGLEWIRSGFASKLKKIATEEGLTGPLPKPYEPWHFGIP
jgi:hypothetical protein